MLDCQILIITHSKDYTVDYLIKKYPEIHFFRFNTDLIHDYIIEVSLKETTIQHKKTQAVLSKSNCLAMYYRKIKLPSFDEFDIEYRNALISELLTTIGGIAEIFGEKALSRPSILKYADNKIIQLEKAVIAGFNIPEFLITNNEKRATEFVNQGHESIVKPLSIGKIQNEHSTKYVQTNLVDITMPMDELDKTPTYFQRYQPKTFEVRLTIIDGHFYGVKIISLDKVDWRTFQNHIEYEIIEVPTDIQHKCLQLMEVLNLNFAAFDFIVYQDTYYFLELNANGQWLWLEKELDLSISEEIINYLTKVKK